MYNVRGNEGQMLTKNFDMQIRPGESSRGEAGQKKWELVCNSTNSRLDWPTVRLSPSFIYTHWHCEQQRQHHVNSYRQTQQERTTVTRCISLVDLEPRRLFFYTVAFSAAKSIAEISANFSFFLSMRFVLSSAHHRPTRVRCHTKLNNLYDTDNVNKVRRVQQRYRQW